MDILGEYTPTEWLVMEVLAARRRLGVTIWPFPKRLKPTLKKLENKNLIQFKSGYIENTFSVWLSDKGIKEWKIDELQTPET